MRSFLKSLLAAALVALLPIGASAQQTLLQGGPFAAGHAPMYVGQGSSQPVVQDSGTAAGGGMGTGLSELGLTVRGTGTAPYANAGTGLYGTNFCNYDAPITNATGYHYLCMSPNAQGGGVIAYGAGGSATPAPLYFIINGQTYQFPGTGNGDVVGPVGAVSNNFVSFNGTSGTLVKDSGISASLVVSGPGSSVSGNVVTFSGTSGKQIADSGLLSTNLALGAASSTSGHLASFSGTGGKQLADSGVALSSVVTGPGSSTTGDIPKFSDTTGKILADGYSPSDNTKSTVAMATGAITSGHLAVFSDTSGTIQDGGAVPSASTAIVPPQGRLNLSSNTPVMITDQINTSIIYYDCYNGGNQVPYYTGSVDASDTISGCQTSLVMQTSSTGVTNSGGVFDIWWVHSGGSKICVATNGSGGGWASDTGGSNTARGTGYTQLDKTTRSYITNANTIPNCYNGSTNYGSIAANRATYLGTIYTTAAGQTGMGFKPSASSGGTANILGLYNGYNRVTVTGLSRDSTGSWTYATATWRSANGNPANRVSFVDGLQQSSISTKYSSGASTSGAVNGLIGADLDSTSAAPDVAASYSDPTSGAVATISANGSYSPQLGFHFIQAVEYAQGATVTFDGTIIAQVQGLFVSLEM